MALYLDKQGKVTDTGGTWVCSSCIDSGFMQDMAAAPPQGRQRPGGGGVYLSDLTNKERAAIVASQGSGLAPGAPGISGAQPPAAGTRAAYMAIPGVRQVIEMAPGHLRVRELEAAEAEIRRELEDTIGRTPDPARSTVQLAREVAGVPYNALLDAEHYRSEAAKVSDLESSLTGLLHRETGLQVDLDRARAEIRSLQAKLAAATLGGTDAERLHDLEAAGRDARDWIVEAMSRRSNGDVDEVLALAHWRLEAMNLGDGDPDAEARAHAYPDDSAGADEGRVAALERAIVEAVGLLACHDLHGDETALAARQAFEGLGIPGLVMVTRCASCAEPIEEEAETCPDCGVSLFNNVVTGLEALGHEEGDGDA